MNTEPLLKPDQPEFLILRASAGSGKTYNLVLYYLLAALNDSDDFAFSSILAITFTNKAADEMKSRIIEGMKRVAEGESPYNNDLCSELGISPEVLRDRAQRQYDAMMTRYGQIAVMTIDKFVNRLVRNFTRELSMDGDFRIELNEEHLIAKAVDELLARVGPDDPELTRVVEGFVLQRIEDEDSWLIRDELIKFGKLLFKEEIRPVLNALSTYKPTDFINLQRTYLKEIHKADTAAVEAARSAAREIGAAGLEKAFSGHHIPKFFDRIASGDLREPSATIQGQFDGVKSLCKSGTPSEEEAAVAAFLEQHLRKPYHQILEALDPKLSLKRGLMNSMYPLAVLQQLQETIYDVRTSANAFTFADLNRTIEQLVASSPAPFIFERIGERYKYFLIDEFQDTSVVQWQNFLPLIENSLATGHFNLIVGDGKQAIYRWRNGDVRQLQQLPDLIGRELTPQMKERQDTLHRYHRERNLGDNWRSRENVVRFNNELFEDLCQYLGEEHRDIYEKLAQEPRKHKGGWITADAYPARPAADRDQLRHERILDLVKKNRELGYDLRDIAILTRSGKEARGIARYLLDNRVSTITSESLRIGLHVAPLAVVQMLRLLHNPDDMQAAARLVQCLAAYYPGIPSLEDIYERYVELPDKQRKRGRIKVRELVNDLLGVSDFSKLASRNLYDLVEHLMSLLKVNEHYPAYAEALLQMALDYQLEESEGLSGFLYFWDNEGHRKSITVPDNIDGVRVMTVHKSKGLEFPVVIALIPDSSRGGASDLHPVDLDPEIFGIPTAVVPLSQMKGTWANDQYEAEKSRELLDEMNVIYVACTRAADHLHLLIEHVPKKKNETWDSPHKMVAKVVAERMGEALWEERVAEGEPVLKEGARNEDMPHTLSSLKRSAATSRLRISVRPEGYDPILRRLTARQEGTEVHRLLAMIRALADIEPVLAMPYPWQRMDRSSWEAILQKVRAVVNMPQMQQWLSEEVSYIEREWINDQGEVIRPDRVIQNSSGSLVVLDYKTGGSEEAHVQQIQHYCEALRQGTDRSVEGWLLYTDKLMLEQIIG